MNALYSINSFKITLHQRINEGRNLCVSQNLSSKIKPRLSLSLQNQKRNLNLSERNNSSNLNSSKEIDSIILQFKKNVWK